MCEGDKKVWGRKYHGLGLYELGRAGFVAKIDGKMDPDLYRSILDEDLMKSLEWYGDKVEDMIFQQDNDPKHKSKKAKEWLEEHEMEVLLWPANSPDLNSIEHLWTYVKDRLKEYEGPPSGVLELWKRVENVWNDIPPEVCQNLIESMPRRIQAVIKAKGRWTKY
jgi:hypothetical protein